MKIGYIILIVIMPIIAIVLFVFHVQNLIESQNMLKEAQKDLNTAKSNVLTHGPLTYNDCLDRLITNQSECENVIRYSKAEMEK
jgi:hypothetical protein